MLSLRWSSVRKFETDSSGWLVLYMHKYNILIQDCLSDENFYGSPVVRVLCLGNWKCSFLMMISMFHRLISLVRFLEKIAYS